MNAHQEAKLDQVLEFITRGGTAQAAINGTPAASPAAASGDEEELYQRFRARLAKEAPALLKVIAISPEIEVTTERKTIVAEESSTLGMIAILLKEGFLKDAVTATNVWKELKRRWNFAGISVRTSEQLNKLTAMGFVSKEAEGYRAVPGMKVRIVEK